MAGWKYTQKPIRQIQKFRPLRLRQSPLCLPFGITILDEGLCGPRFSTEKFGTKNVLNSNVVVNISLDDEDIECISQFFSRMIHNLVI